MINTEVLLNSIHTDTLLLHRKQSDLFNQTIHCRTGSGTFCSVDFIVSHFLTLKKIHQPPKLLFIPVFQIVIKGRDTPKAKLLYHHIHSGNCFGMKDYFTESILFINIRQYGIKNTVFLCHLLNLLHILGFKLQYLQVSTFHKKLSHGCLTKCFLIIQHTLQKVDCLLHGIDTTTANLHCNLDSVIRYTNNLHRFLNFFSHSNPSLQYRFSESTFRYKLFRLFCVLTLLVFLFLLPSALIDLFFDFLCICSSDLLLRHIHTISG